MSHTLEITILSAENLHMNKKTIKKNAFVSLQCDSSSEICSTKVNNSEEGGGGGGGGGGGSCPTWNERLVMELPLDARFITAEVKCKASSRGGIKSVGMARIPVSDLDVQENNQVQFLSYRLWDSRVRRNGVINVSVRIKVLEYCFPVTGVPVASDGSSGSGVVTGIPVWLSNL